MIQITNFNKYDSFESYSLMQSRSSDDEDLHMIIDCDTKYSQPKISFDENYANIKIEGTRVIPRIKLVNKKLHADHEFKETRSFSEDSSGIDMVVETITKKVRIENYPNINNEKTRVPRIKLINKKLDADLEPKEPSSFSEDSSSFDMVEDIIPKKVRTHADLEFKEPSSFSEEPSSIDSNEDIIIKKVRTEYGSNKIMLSEKNKSSHQNKIEMAWPIDETSILQDEINVVTLQELIDDLESQNYPTPADRFHTLLNAFTYVPHEQPYMALWLKLPGSMDKNESYMFMTIGEFGYYSQCLEENDQYPGIYSPINQSYYFINAYDQNNMGKLYFQFRINKGCSNAEIVHIQSGAEITGTQVKGICMRILNYIQPEIVVLYDDSKIASKNQKKYMRLYMPIVNEFPKTWYSEDNFQVCNMNMPLNFKGKHIPYQGLESYCRAVNTIRSTKMETLALQVNSIIPKRFLPYLTAEQKQNLNNVTVHDVGKAIFQELKKINHAAGKAGNDFAFFYEKCLATTAIFNAPAHYYEALNVLFDTKIWIQINSQPYTGNI